MERHRIPGAVLGSLSTGLREREYRPAYAVGQQVIKLHHQLGDDADTTAGGFSGGYHSFDGQFPAPAPCVADAWGNQKGRVSAWP